MSKTTFLAVVDGKVIGKRTSAHRPYTHVVIGRIDIEKNRKAAYEFTGADHTASDFAFYRAYLDGTSKFLRRKEWHTDEQHAAQVAHDIDRAKRALGGSETLEQYIALQRQRYIDGFEAAVASGYYDMKALRWSMSYGNALKGAAEFPGCVDVRVIPVTVK